MTSLEQVNETIPISTSIPKRVFIVPYRNRVQQKFFFEKYMTFILEHDKEYEIYFSHQCDSRSFNRGATKNIGFQVVKNKYPQHYRNMTFIFNDVDTIPFHKIFDYETTSGVVKHYYGYQYTLGGIVVMKGSDFERINGFPNYWGWGNEDNILQTRCYKYGLYIDRSIFYPIGSPEILQLFDGMSRIISKKDFSRRKTDTGHDGLMTLFHLKYTIDATSLNPNDNVFINVNSRIFIINITEFMTETNAQYESFYSYDLREPIQKIVNPDPTKRTNHVVANPDQWKNIPYYPTLQERKQQQQQQPHLQLQQQTQRHYATPNYRKHQAMPSANIGLGGVKPYR